MSEVWRAFDAERAQDIALKILNQALAEQAGFVELLHAECAKARQLRHPNIVRVYDAHTESGLHFISMEYVAGPSLKELRGTDWRAIVKMLLPLTDALDYAHSAGIVHRDIKPANVLLVSPDDPRLTDFGIASLLTAQYSAQVRTGGSLPTMSPQQVKGESPCIADDVYGFGTLIYDLISGAPLFHPDVTRERVIGEKPAPLKPLNGDAAIPQRLVGLVAAMLEKETARRPVGMSAVGAALTEILTDVSAKADEEPPSIQAVARRRRSSAPHDEVFQPQRLEPADAKHAGSRRLLYAGFGILAAVALAVVFLLPGYMEEQAASRPPVELVREPAVEPPAADTVPGETGSRQVADQALGDLLAVEDRLQAKAVELWGGADWAAARAAVTEGDDFYKVRDYAAATVAYRQAAGILGPLVGRAPDVLATALADGANAVEAGNQQLAIERYDLALAIDKENAAAQAGRSRALRLDQVLALVEEASGHEFAQQWRNALESYREALAIDPDWEAAVTGRDRVRGIIAGNDYQAAMSTGYAALAAANYPVAKREFTAALNIRPNDADAQTALGQIETEQRLARIIRLSAEAEQLQSAEDWVTAGERYESILGLDATVVSARMGLESSRERAELDRRMRESIGSPDRLADDAVWQVTRTLVEFARGAQPRGPVLTGQIDELDRLLQRALVPVSVQFQSDNLTDVVIYKVGRLGTFVTRSIELRPGSYTAVGIRNGYRDVRTTFSVAPEVAMQPIVLRCEDPI
jgi:tetratricopeptide (TPR) repeat protein